MSPPTGILLLNLGTPDQPTTKSVRMYLKQFLSDPRVLDLPAPARWLLLRLFILPFRPKKSAAAYGEIWTEQGSPLLVHTADLARAVQQRLGPEVSVRFAMRYQNPSMTSALKAFAQQGVVRLIVVPLYPHYASSSSGSCLEQLYSFCAREWNVPALSVLPPFFDHPAFIQSLAEVARESLGSLEQYDHFLFSYHGLPERHLTKTNSPHRPYCFQRSDCCETLSAANSYCYRAQSLATTKMLAQRLGIPEGKYSSSFQSRLGRTPWIKPYTDEVLQQLPGGGCQRLAVLIPSFTADCLETLEEIQLRGRASFMAAGGTHFHMVPSQNAHPSWVQALCRMIRELGLPEIAKEAEPEPQQTRI